MINHIISECSKLAQKNYKTKHDRVRKGNPLEIVSKNKILPYEQMVYAQLRICPGQRDALTPLGFGDINGLPNLHH